MIVWLFAAFVEVLQVLQRLGGDFYAFFLIACGVGGLGVEGYPGFALADITWAVMHLKRRSLGSYRALRLVSSPPHAWPGESETLDSGCVVAKHCD